MEEFQKKIINEKNVSYEEIKKAFSLYIWALKESEYLHCVLSKTRPNTLYYKLTELLSDMVLKLGNHPTEPKIIIRLINTTETENKVLCVYKILIEKKVTATDKIRYEDENEEAQDYFDRNNFWFWERDRKYVPNLENEGV